MSRSAKKGFFVDEKLMKRINEQNEKNEQRVLKTWSRASTIFPRWWVTLLPYMTEENTFRSILRKIWLVTNSVNLLRQEHSEAMPALKNASR